MEGSVWGGGGVLSSLPQAEVAAAQVDGEGVVKLLDGDVHQRVRVPVVHNACGGNAVLAAHRWERKLPAMSA